jgi:hypothetical protein
MASARPLRDVFADLTGGGSTGDPGALLRDQGHPALPEDLVAQAVISYADTAPAEIAEHLAPYVTAHSVVGAGEEPADGWLDLLGTAPADFGPAGEPGEIDDLAAVRDEFAGAGDLGPGLDFGTGAGGPAPVADAVADADAVDDSGELEDPAGAEDPEVLPDPADLDDAGDILGWAAADETTVDDMEPDEDDEPLE